VSLDRVVDEANSTARFARPSGGPKEIGSPIASTMLLQ
jgi:hypothetical protein